MSVRPAVLPDLDFAWARSIRVPPGSTYGPYTTVYWEFIWCLDGSAQVRSGDEEFVFRPGSLQLTPPGVRNYYQWHPATGTQYGYAIFTMGSQPSGWPRFRGPRSGDIVAPLLDHVLWLDAFHPQGWRESATVALGYAIRAFTLEASAIGHTGEDQFPEVVVAALEAVRQRQETRGPGQPSLGELAAAAGVTREYLCRVFAKHVGVGPVAAIRTLRLHRAAALLTSTNLGVAEIAQHLGFTSEFQFSRSFRGLTGQAPTVFRRNRDAHVALPIRLRQLGRHLNLP